MARIPITEQPEPFTSFKEEFKEPEDGSSYEDLQSFTIQFDSKDVKLIDPHNLEQLIIEMNSIPSTLFKYRMIMDTQAKLVQQLEDEYTKWYAQKWMEVDSQTEPKLDKAGNVIGQVKIVRTEGAKEKVIITTFTDEYDEFQRKIREEKYRLSLIKSTVSSIDSYSYKLHSILNYKQMLEAKHIS
jgi:hypothetical protein